MINFNFWGAVRRFSIVMACFLAMVAWLISSFYLPGYYDTAVFMALPLGFLFFVLGLE